MGSTTNKVILEKTRKARKIDVRVCNRSRNNDCSPLTNTDCKPTATPVASLQYHHACNDIVTVSCRMDRRVKAVRKEETLPPEIQAAMERVLRRYKRG